MYTCDIMYEFLSRILSLNPRCALKLMEDSLSSVILPTKAIKMIITHVNFVAFQCPLISPLSTASHPQTDISSSFIRRMVMTK